MLYKTQTQEIRLEVKRLGRDKIPTDELQCCSKLLLKLFTAHNFGGLGYLPEQLLQSPEKANQTTFVDIGHFAETH